MPAGLAGARLGEGRAVVAATTRAGAGADEGAALATAEGAVLAQAVAEGATGAGASEGAADGVGAARLASESAEPLAGAAASVMVAGGAGAWLRDRRVLPTKIATKPSVATPIAATKGQAERRFAGDCTGVAAPQLLCVCGRGVIDPVDSVRASGDTEPALTGVV